MKDINKIREKWDRIDNVIIPKMMDHPFNRFVSELGNPDCEISINRTNFSIDVKYLSYYKRIIIEDDNIEGILDTHVENIDKLLTKESIDDFKNFYKEFNRDKKINQIL